MFGDIKGQMEEAARYARHVEAQRIERLRDEFAMAALKGYLSNGEASLNGAEPTGYFVSKADGRKWVAEWSYLMADAMMEARK